MSCAETRRELPRTAADKPSSRGSSTMLAAEVQHRIASASGVSCSARAPSSCAMRSARRQPSTLGPSWRQPPALRSDQSTRHRRPPALLASLRSRHRRHRHESSWPLACSASGGDPELPVLGSSSAKEAAADPYADFLDPLHESSPESADHFSPEPGVSLFFELRGRPTSTEKVLLLVGAGATMRHAEQLACRIAYACGGSRFEVGRPAFQSPSVPSSSLWLVSQLVYPAQQWTPQTRAASAAEIPSFECALACRCSRSTTEASAEAQSRRI